MGAAGNKKKIPHGKHKASYMDEKETNSYANDLKKNNK